MPPNPKGLKPPKPPKAHYKLCSVLGKGSAGTIYLAYDVSKRRMVALKHLSPEAMPFSNLRLLAQLLSAHRIDATAGSVPLEPEEARGIWEKLRPEYATDFAVGSGGPPSGRVSREFGDRFERVAR